MYHVMKYFLTILTIAFSLATNAQAFQWAKNIIANTVDPLYGVTVTSITIDQSGNLITVGSFSGTYDFDPGPGIFNLSASMNTCIFISKLDNGGNFIWAKMLGSGPGMNFNQGNSVTTDPSGNIYVTGQFQDNMYFGGAIGIIAGGPTSSFLIFKMDSNGNYIWAKSIGLLSSGASICLDQYNNVYTTGYFVDVVDFDPGIGIYNLSSYGAKDAFIQKLDANGQFIWAKNIGSVGDDYGNSIKIDSSGNVYTTGNFKNTIDFDPGPLSFLLNSMGGTDAYVLKLDSLGNFIWATSIGDTSDENATSLYIDIQHNIYTTGSFTGTVDFDPGVGISHLISAGTQDAFIQKLDSGGHYLWAKRYGSTDLDVGNSITIDSLSNVYVIGTFTGTVDFDPSNGVYNLVSTGPANDIFISSLDSNGQFKWAKRIGNIYEQYKNLSIASEHNGNLFSTGQLYFTIDFDPGIGIFNLIPTYEIGVFIQKYHYCGVNYVESDSACNSITINGITYNASGIYLQEYADINGCDSNIQYHITINSNSDTITQIACNSYTLNGQTYTASGQYSQNFVNIWGCDSLVILNLTIDTLYSIINQNACNSYTLNGQTYTTSGQYTQNFVNALGCDSVVLLNLTIDTLVNVINQTTCNNVFILNGQTYNANGTYMQYFTNLAGCDSVIILNLNFILTPPPNDTIYTAICYPNAYLFNGTYYFNSGIYSNIYPLANGCDSTITLFLTVNYPSSSTIIDTACHTYFFNGGTYYSSGTYINTIPNAVNCDSVITLQLTINPNTDVTQIGPSLTSNAIGASYQWLSCNPFQEIIGETNQTFNAITNGDFAVAVTENGCTDTSECYSVIGLTNDEQKQLLNIKLYPNPITQKLYLTTENAFQHASIRIRNIDGQLLHEFTNISTSIFVVDMIHYSTGTYLIEIICNGYTYTRLVTKI